MTPVANSPIASAAHWIEAVLLGPVALTIAILAVAAYGFLILSGHVDWRRGVRIVIGCFILFGAPLVATGIMGVSGSGAADDAIAMHEPPAYQPSPRQGGAICWTCGIAPAEPAER